MCLIHIKVRPTISKTFQLYGLVVMNVPQAPPPNGTCTGQNKPLRNASLLMCHCSFAIGQLKNSKVQSERYAIDLIIQVQTSADHCTSNTN